MEKTIELEISHLLPGVKDEKDLCISRLQASLQNRRGILRLHLEGAHSPGDTSPGDTSPGKPLPLDLCLHYDPNLVSMDEVQRMARQAGVMIANRFHHTSFPIEGMDCSDCSLVLEHSVKRMPGVVAATVNYAAETMWVEFDSQKTSRLSIEKRVRSLGYQIPLNGFQARLFENRELLFSLLSGLLLLTGWAGRHLLGFPAPLSLGLYLGGYLFGGWYVTRYALVALRERHFDTDSLMVIVALGAAILGDFAEGALLLFLFSLGHALEERLLNRARKAIRSLADLAPKTAMLRRDGREFELPVDALLLGDVVIVRPGVRLPVDGKVLTGQSVVDQASVTGESIPVDKVSGDLVFAGTINGEAALEIQVTRLAKDSTLARVTKMVEEAQAQKAPTQQIVEKFERIFVPAVLILTVAVIVIPTSLGMPLSQAFLRSMTLLVGASPCALALGTPAAILAGVAQAARNGVLVKGGMHLENLGRLKAIAFDKTGTITHGKPEVTDIIPSPLSPRERVRVRDLDSNEVSSPLSPRERVRVRDLDSNEVSSPLSPRERVRVRDLDSNEGSSPLFPESSLLDQDREKILSIAATAESRSAHPLAQAVVRAAQSHRLPVLEFDEAVSLTSLGMRLKSKTGTFYIGSQNLMEEKGVHLSEQALSIAHSLQQEGKTLIWVAEGQNALGLLALADTLRGEAPAALKSLQRLGITHTIMLTGDNPRSAAAIAAEAGMSEVRADLMPEDKLTVIQQLVQEHGQVAMVGDGVNDAPAMANATVGIAMGGAGTDVALETADVALMGDDLSRLSFAVGVGRFTRNIILQNLAISLGVIGFLMLASLTGIVSIGVAVVVHESSTLVVVLNALRLLAFNPKG